ncbi:MAG: choice-of-anchor L domain-containing protein, partial [Nannocystaceae bacterium]
PIADFASFMTFCAGIRKPGEAFQLREGQADPCDEGANSMISALGLNCPGDALVEVTTFGNPAAMSVRTGFGGTGEWNPREGSAFAVLGSGFTTDLDLETPFGDPDIGPTHCNDDLGAEYDVGTALPAPLLTNDVAGDCSTNDALLGTGDCSNTIQGQFSQGGSANDYTEIRIVADVPITNNSVSYDFAFFSTEYPFYFGSAFNDMYIGWLESESWTGNISFDSAGNPISLNAGFLDFRDDGGALPEFAGTCMRQHAGTTWLNSTAPVTPGETITLVLAVFDLSDSILDSYVFLDNFGWGCDGEDTPQTNPVG